MADHKVPQCNSGTPVVPTAGEVFSNGSILELVRIPTGELNLLLWDGKSANMAPQFVLHDHTFVPLGVHLLRSMRLPSNIAEHESTRVLFTEISSLISRVTDAGDRFAQLVTFSVFATWFPDCLPFAPYLWIVAPPAITTAAPLVQLLSLLCRHSLVINDISSAGFHSLSADLQPTVLAEVFKPTHRTLGLLRASNRPGVFDIANGKATNAFKAKIVIAPEPLGDPASGGFPLELALSPPRKYVPLMTSSEAEGIAAEYQGKLLHYRLLNWAKVRAPAFDFSQFTAPMRELAHSLAASIVDDDELQSEIVALLKPLDREICVDRASQLPAVVLEALLARCRSTTGKNYRVGDLTGDVNTILRGRRSLLEVSPEEIGWKLRVLGLHTDFMPGGTKGLVLSDDVRKKILDLAAAHGVRMLRDRPEEIGAGSRREADPARTIGEQP